MGISSRIRSLIFGAGINDTASIGKSISAKLSIRPDLDNLLEGVHILSPDLVYLYLNDVAEKHLQRPKSDLLGKRYEDLWPVVETTAVYKNIMECFRDNAPKHFNYEFISLEGKTSWFELRIQRVPEGILLLSIDRSDLHQAEMERRATEEALRAKEEKYRYMFANNPQPMWIYDLESLAFLEVNDAAIAKYGYTREEFLGMTLKDIRPAEDIPALLVDVSVTKRTYNPAGEWRHLTKSGDLMTVEITSHTVDFNGRVARHVIVTDITERKKVLIALSESEHKFRNIYEEGPFGMALVGRDYKFIDVNNKFCDIVGYSRSELQQMTFINLTYPEDIEKDNKFVPKLMNGELPLYKAEKRYVNKNGNIVWGALTVSAMFDQNHDFLYNVAILDDITPKKNAEHELIKNRTYLDAALASMTDAVFITNLEGEFVLFNDAFVTFHKFRDISECPKKVEDYPGIIDVFLSDSTPVPFENRVVKRSLRGEVGTDVEYVLRRKDTGESWVGSYGFSPIKDSDGNIFGSVVVARDVTKQKIADEELRKLNETLELKVEERTAQLTDVNKELEAFSYTVSHDLRAPLRSINGFTQILTEEYAGKLDKEGIRLFNIVLENSQKMGELIDSLLSFSRLGRVELKKVEINMKEMVAEVFRDLAVNENGSNIDFDLGDICIGFGDPGLIRQIWTNLISNAIKYSSKKEKSTITVRCRRENDFCIYSVKDNGVGFDMAYKDKLFGVFQRLHGQREFSGTGVGLAIVQRIVHRHDGIVWAEAEPDKGAVFSFSLPLVK